MTAYKKTTESDLYALKIECLLTKTPSQVVNALFDNWIDYNREIQGSDYLEGSIAKRYNDDAYLVYERFAGPSPFISDRDLVTASTRVQVSENSWAKVDCSVRHPDFPEVAGVVRAELSYGMHLCADLQNGRTLMTVTALGDPKGKIPKFAVNFGLTRRVKSYHKLIRRLNTA